MLRWCLSTVRHLGGHSNILQKTRPSPTAVPCKRLNNRVTESSSLWLDTDVSLRPNDSNCSVINLERDASAEDTPERLSHGMRRLFRHRRLRNAITSSSTTADNLVGDDAGEEQNQVLLPSQSMNPGPSPLVEAAISTSTIPAPNNVHTTPEISTRPEAKDILRMFFSFCNISSSQAQLHTPNTLRSLYLSAKSRSQIAHLDLSSLISLFGSLSMPSEGHSGSSIYIHPLSSKLGGPRSRVYWPFVLQVAQDKERLVGALNVQDRYWVMRAHLAELSSSDLSYSNPTTRSHLLSQARFQYLRISHRSAHPDIHVPFLQALLTFGDPKHFTEAVDRLCLLLRQQHWCHPRLVDLLWGVILKSGTDVPARVQEQLLSTLWERASKVDNITPSSAAGPCELPKLRHDLVLPVSSVDGIGVTNLCTIFMATIFSQRPSLSLLSMVLQQWAIAQAQGVFSPKAPKETRWHDLVLLALSNAPSSLVTASGGLILDHLSHRNPSTSSWRFVCALATLEKMMGPLRSQPDVMENARAPIRELWRAWSTASEDVKPPVLVIRAIATSFLRLSAITADSHLMEACYRHCNMEDLWDSNDSYGRQGLRALAAEYIMASVACGGTRWGDIVASLNILPEPEWLPAAIGDAVLRFVSQDLSIAHQIVVFTDRHGPQLPRIIVHKVAIALASAGHIDHAIHFMTIRDWCRSEKEQLLGAIIHAISRVGSRHLDRDVFVILGDIMQSLYQSSPPSPRMRALIEYILPVMSTSGHLSRAMSIFQTIHQASPLYLRMPFFQCLLKTLLAQRQFRRAAYFFSLVAKSRPHGLSTLQRLLLLELARSGASVVALRASRILVGRRHVGTCRSLAFAHSLKYQTRRPPRSLSAKILPAVRKSNSDHDSMRLALYTLVRAGRLLAAKKLYDGIQSTLDSAFHTSMGNILLHATLSRGSRRNGRQMRKTLATMGDLVKKYGFVPDRVTVNILLKATIRWRGMIDSKKLRALFDHMIRSGYPAGDYTHRGVMPFETTFSSTRKLRLPRLSLHMSFKRHVRPMYKMFIKGFYLRGDVQAAKTVIGILKSEGANSLETEERRGRVGDNHLNRP